MCRQTIRTEGPQRGNPLYLALLIGVSSSSMPSRISWFFTETIPVILHHRGHEIRLFAFDRSDASHALLRAHPQGRHSLTSDRRRNNHRHSRVITARPRHGRRISCFPPSLVCIRTVSRLRGTRQNSSFKASSKSLHGRVRRARRVHADPSFSTRRPPSRRSSSDIPNRSSTSRA